LTVIVVLISTEGKEKLQNFDNFYFAGVRILHLTPFPYVRSRALLADTPSLWCGHPIWMAPKDLQHLQKDTFTRFLIF
jgi:hypothetical protein